MRILVSIVAVAALALPATTSARTSRTGAPAASAARVLLRDLNNIRFQNGLPALRLSPRLSAAATSHARSMSELGYFAHDLGGTPFNSWIQRFYPTRGFRSWTAGENILWATQPLTPNEALDLWMQSPGHRRNILFPGYREVGIATVDVNGAPGVFQGLDVTIAVTDFGARQTAAAG